MNVLAIQLDIVWENKAANFDKVRALVQRARPEPGSLVVLPEMFATGFSMNAGSIAENYGGETEQFLACLARDCRSYIVGGAAMRGKDGLARNKALVFSPSGDLLAFYAKMRPFTPGGEAEHYTAGQKPSVFRCGEWTVAPFVCYDLRFPELFRHAAAAHRPELFLVIASWPAKRISHWDRLLQARAIENQAFAVGVNRVGSDPYYSYPGHTAIIDPHGNVIADAGEVEGTIQAKVTLEELRKYREGLPFLNDLRAEGFDRPPSAAR